MGEEFYSEDNCVAAGEFLVDIELSSSFKAAIACVGDSLETQMQQGYDNTQAYLTGDLKVREAEAFGSHEM